jgi:ABC-2 type transport system permease protein
MPGALSTRLSGKYLGGIVATLLPMFAFYVVGVGYILIQTQNLLTLPLSLVTFVAIVLPGALFVSAFSLACTSVLWVPLYQFLFICYWFWGNILTPNIGIPTISYTILTPIGHYIAQGIFGGTTDSGINATPQLGFASLLTLVGFALFALFVLYGFLKWQQARQ